MRKLTTKEFIERAKIVHGDFYDYSKTIYKGAKEKVCIICPKHGEFLQLPSHHLKSQGCSRCARESRLAKDSFFEKAKQIHGNKYDYSKVEYKGNKVKVCIICPIHGEFWQRPNDHLSGHGCDYCRSDSHKKLLCNWGINDMINERGTTAYRIWEHMIYRCKSNNRNKNIKSYDNCSIAEEWKLFSNFKKWFDENYIEGWDIDKDLFSKAEKIYSPQTCCFLPKSINKMIKKSIIDNKMTCIVKNKNTYYLSFKSIDAYVRKTFNSLEDAIAFYREEKNKKAKVSYERL